MSDKDIYRRLYGRFIKAAFVSAAIMIIGTLGYRFLTDGQYSYIDCFYMVIITITTIGFSEVVDLSGNPAGRLFTIVISLVGTGVLFYALSNITAFFVEEELTESFRRRKMDKMIEKLRDHYIICGAGKVGYHIISELFSTERPYVIVDIDSIQIKKVEGDFPNQLIVDGNATDDRTLLRAGVAHAKGLFAVTDDDNQNLVISLTARHLNSDIKIVSRCVDVDNIGKMKKAGANSVISPNSIGGLRMATEMIKPMVVSFLDTMLRDKKKNLRVEEYTVPDSLAGRKLSDLPIKECKRILLMAVHSVSGWAYAPEQDYEIVKGDTLVFMATPEERRALERLLNKGN